MNCEHYKQGSECSFAAQFYGKPVSELSPDKIDYIAEFCILANGSCCRDREGLTKQLNSQTAA